MPPRGSPPPGRWRTAGMAPRDAGFVGVLEPAHVALGAKGGGESVFGAARGDLDCRRGPDGARSTRDGLDGMGAALGAGSAELAPDGWLARRRDPLPPRRRVHLQGAPMVTSSAAC